MRVNGAFDTRHLKTTRGCFHYTQERYYTSPGYRVKKTEENLNLITLEDEATFVNAWIGYYHHGINKCNTYWIL